MGIEVTSGKGTAVVGFARPLTFHAPWPKQTDFSSGVMRCITSALASAASIPLPPGRERVPLEFAHPSRDIRSWSFPEYVLFIPKGFHTMSLCFQPGAGCREPGLEVRDIH